MKATWRFGECHLFFCYIFFSHFFFSNFREAKMEPLYEVSTSTISYFKLEDLFKQAALNYQTFILWVFVLFCFLLFCFVYSNFNITISSPSFFFFFTEWRILFDQPIYQVHQHCRLRLSCRSFFFFFFFFFFTIFTIRF